MSVVTGIMLVIGASDWDGDAIGEVQSWLAEHGHGPLVDCSDTAGGNKHPQFEAWAAGYNYFLDVEEFIGFAMSRDWRAPENMFLTVHPEDGATRAFRPANYGVDQIEVLADEA